MIKPVPSPELQKLIDKVMVEAEIALIRLRRRFGVIE